MLHQMGRKPRDYFATLGQIRLRAETMAGDRTIPDLDYFFALTPDSITWPSLNTTLSTEAKSGSARKASATLNDGSGFH
jgi:hypothetical protein